jgi:hypothetical protein
MDEKIIKQSNLKEIRYFKENGGFYVTVLPLAYVHVFSVEVRTFYACQPGTRIQCRQFYYIRHILGLFSASGAPMNFTPASA